MKRRRKKWKIVVDVEVAEEVKAIKVVKKKRKSKEEEWRYSERVKKCCEYEGNGRK